MAAERVTARLPFARSDSADYTLHGGRQGRPLGMREASTSLPQPYIPPSQRSQFYLDANTPAPTSSAHLSPRLNRNWSNFDNSPSASPTRLPSPLPSPFSINSEKSSFYSPNDSHVLLPLSPDSLYHSPPRSTLINKSRSRKRLWIILGVVIALVIVAIVVGVTLSKKSSTAAVAEESLSGDTLGEENPTVYPVSSSSSIAIGQGASVANPKQGSSTIANGAISSTTVAIVPAVGTAVPLAAAVELRRLITFGASYCDNAHARPAKYEYSLTTAPYYQGRKSNGIVWVEYLAGILAINGKIDSRNYAYSGAVADNSLNNAATSTTVPDIVAQMASFTADIKSGLVPALPGKSRTLVIVWIGVNIIVTSYNNLMLNANPSSASIATAVTLMQTNVAHLFDQITSLRTQLSSSPNSADFLILPAPPLQLLPFANAATTIAQGVMKTLTNAYNDALKSRLSNLPTVSNSVIFSYDMTTFYTNIINNPSLGSFTNVARSCVVGTAVCANPSGYMWFDSTHMTTTLHQEVAQAVSPQILAHWTG